MPDNLRLTFYGDDFTGSTDVMESLSLNGVRTVLFLEPPSSEQLSEFPDVQAVGVCGRSRSMTPTEMDATLPDTFEALAELGAPICQYKVCSTFDSSPSVGSVGHAIDIGRTVFSSDSFTPLVVGAPPLSPRGRYVVFGNLFAAVEGEVYRLDRHPTMSTHPVTPMTESDLGRHLSEQTETPTALVDLRALRGTETAVDAAVSDAKSDGDIVVFDTLTEEDLETIGRVVWEDATDTQGTTFSVGSSGLDYALARHWEARGEIPGTHALEHPGAEDQIAVISGSASVETRTQIDWALKHEFDGVRLDTAALIDPAERKVERDRAVQRACEIAQEGQSPILFAAKGPDDQAIDQTKTRAETLELPDEEIGSRLGTQQGKILRDILVETGFTRACIAGGDTSGYATPELDIYALETLIPTEPGCPICTAFSHDERFDGLEIVLKGGQVGHADYFRLVREGGRQPER